MPPPPLKIVKVFSEKEQTIEALLIETGFVETLEAFRNERNNRLRIPVDRPDSSVYIEKKGDVWCCTFCDKTFTTKGSAKRHLISTHSADSKQFECPRCTSKFARRDDLYTHLRRMHDAGQLVESMIEEHKAELKGEHKGIGLGQLLTVISHKEHLDLLLPSGDTICRPFAVDISPATVKEPTRAARACRGVKCNHWRVLHDVDGNVHEDVLVNGALHHKNEDGEWEFHGEIGNLDDLEFLLAASHNACSTPHLQHSHEPHQMLIPEVCDVPNIEPSSSSASSISGSEPAQPSLFSSHPLEHHDQVLSNFMEEIDFLFNPEQINATILPPAPQKQSVESLILPGGSVICRRPTGTSNPLLMPPTSWPYEQAHKHSSTCGHNRIRHGNHYDYIVDNIIESDHPDCAMRGISVLEQNDAVTLSFVVSALAAEQSANAAVAATAVT